MAGPSFYAYVGDDPVAFSDPSGLARHPVAPPTPQYNCAAWGLGLDWVWVTTPDYKNPSQIFPHFGCTKIPCTTPVNCNLRHKVKVFEDMGDALNWHVERQTCNKGWTSKYGQAGAYDNITNPDADYAEVYKPKGKVKKTYLFSVLIPTIENGIARRFQRLF